MITAAAGEGVVADTTTRFALDISTIEVLQAQVAAQRLWAAAPLGRRLDVMREARHRMAAMPEPFAAAISPQLSRSKADTLVCELLPLLDAMRFLEKNAARVLQTRRLGRFGRPLWLGGTTAEVQRDPWGHVLVIGPSNFPLFLPGVQTMQALAAGNRVTWKPGEGGAPVARLVAEILRQAGLPAGLLTVTDDSAAAGEAALAEGRPDKVIFTGSSSTGQHVMAQLAARAKPAVMELSGADALLVLPSADLDRVAKAVAFGLRLNGGAVCMSPRRLIATRETLHELLPKLAEALRQVEPVQLRPHVEQQLTRMLQDAHRAGAQIIGELERDGMRPLVVQGATPKMAITRSDIFAPVISLLAANAVDDMPEIYAKCRFGLTAAIFCAEKHEQQARSLGAKLRAGVVLLNDVIAPTADARLPFGGRGGSGYGVTRGAEGLLEMTAPKVWITRRGAEVRHFAPTAAEDAPMFAAMIRATHAPTWAGRLQGLRALARFAKRKKVE